MRSSSARYSADPDGLDAQSDLIGAPEPMSIEAVLAAPNSGSGAAAVGEFRRCALTPREWLAGGGAGGQAERGSGATSGPC